MAVSRILLHVPAADVAPIAAVLAAVTDTEAAWDELVRYDGSRAPQGTVTVGGCRIEITEGSCWLPAIIDVTVADPEAAARRAAAAGADVRNTMRGYMLHYGALTLLLREG